jgi:predicted membrane protein
MDTQNQNPDIQRSRRNGRVLAGVFLLFIGAIFFIREADLDIFPGWIFSWPMVLIGFGLFTGLRHDFRGSGWLIMVIIGSIFLLDRLDIGLDLHRFIFPAIVVGIGLTMILRPKRNFNDNWFGGPNGRRRRDRGYRNARYNPTQFSNDLKQDITNDAVSDAGGNPGTTATGNQSTQTNSNTAYPDDFLDVTSVLGSAHRIVASKNFKGGDITCFMGGAEIDMREADIKGTVVLDVTTVMGGAKLIVPSNWEVKPEITNVLGGVEDKRQVQGKVIDFNKVLLLKGTSFMGGIELRSY